MYASKMCLDGLRREMVKVEAQMQLLKNKKHKSAADINELALLSRYYDSCLYQWMKAT